MAILRVVREPFGKRLAEMDEGWMCSPSQTTFPLQNQDKKEAGDDPQQIPAQRATARGIFWLPEWHQQHLPPLREETSELTFIPHLPRGERIGMGPSLKSRESDIGVWRRQT